MRPGLAGDFVDLDDVRFVRDNEAVHRLTPVRFFSDPSRLSEKGWEGTWRPLRTLDFALDWAIPGGAPWFFHLRSLLYHAIGSLLVLALLSRLTSHHRAAVLHLDGRWFGARTGLASTLNGWARGALPPSARELWETSWRVLPDARLNPDAARAHGHGGENR